MIKKSAIATMVAAMLASLTIGIATAGTAAAAAPPQFDTTLIGLINQARTSAHEAPLVEARGLDSEAVYWSDHLLAGGPGKLYHNPDAWDQVAQTGASNRTTWGENVIWASSPISPKQAFDAYMASPGHRANILNPAYHYVGSGTAVSAASGMYETTEFTDQVEPGQVVQPTPAPSHPVQAPHFSAIPNGQYVRDGSSAVVYRIVGGAPLYVSNWTAMGGPASVKSIGHQQFVGLPKYPADGTYVLTPSNHMIYIFAGGAPIYVRNWADVPGRTYTAIDPSDITKASSGGYYGGHVLNQPANGTYLRGYRDSRVYLVSGGVATWVRSWASVGGPHPYTSVDGSTILMAGRGGQYDHLAGVRF